MGEFKSSVYNEARKAGRAMCNEIHLLASICATIDINGFFFDGNFIPREISVRNDEFAFVFQVDSGFEYVNQTSDEITLNHYLATLTGLTLRPADTDGRTLVASNVEEALINIHAAFMKKNRFRFATASSSVADFLTRIGIPNINTKTRFESPTYFDMRTVWPYDEELCKEHKHERFPCAAKTTWYLWKWINARRVGMTLMFENKYGSDEVD